MKILKTDLAWAAGILDGEGYIGMTRIKAGIQRRINPSFQTRISVRMVDYSAVKKLYNMFGGTFKNVKPPNSQKHRASFEWFASDLVSDKVLRKVMPYLVTKKSQASLVVGYRENCVTPLTGHVTPKYLVDLRQSYFDNLKMLNKRGFQTNAA
mgnify:CR=1 FL=1